MPIIDIRERKLKKIWQELVDSGFKYMRYQREGTPHQKATSKRQFLARIEAMHEHLDQGENKVLKMKPKNEPVITTYRKKGEVVHIITPPEI